VLGLNCVRANRTSNAVHKQCTLFLKGNAKEGLTVGIKPVPVSEGCVSMSNNIINQVVLKSTEKKVSVKTETMKDGSIVVSASNFPQNWTDMINYITISEVKEVKDKNGKVIETKGGKTLPVGETELTFSFTLEDGTVSNVSGRLALWLDKSHVKDCKEKALSEERARQDAAKAAKTAAPAAPAATDLKTLPASMLHTLSGDAITALINAGYVFTA